MPQRTAVGQTPDAPDPRDDQRRPSASRPAAQRRWRSSSAPLSIGLTAPVLVLVALVSVVPIVYATRLSLFETQFMNIGEFIGLDNFRQALGTSAARADILRTLVYVSVSLVVAVPLGLALALMLNLPFRFRAAFRAVIFLPWVVSQTVAALLWKWLLNPDYGPLPLGSFDPFADSVMAMGALILANVWISYPLAAMLFLAALQTVPGELLEAAEVDGAGKLRRLVSVILPTIKSTVLIVTIMLTLFFFNMVTLVYTLTAGGPHSATQTLSLQAFRESFQFFHLGLGAAYSIVLFGFNILFGAAYVRVLRSEK
ncbi:carbohydrate ABC transporter permease [Jiangella asiatica]|uniref:carbohydrate ABC transporter permease n=1 Tax=Jiangella asiatica TaxID=2530372 RepID=UPI0013A5DE3E|nr:sugar ABC transporter permease [Jiangella asiatica]